MQRTRLVAAVLWETRLEMCNLYRRTQLSRAFFVHSERFELLKTHFMNSLTVLSRITTLNIPILLHAKFVTHNIKDLHGRHVLIVDHSYQTEC
jgi:hypothetical protein